MTRFWIPAALVLLAALTLLACSGDDKDGAGTSGGATAGDGTPGDCEYATAFVRSLEAFRRSAPSGATSADTEAALRTFDTFDGELGALIGELRSYRLSTDVAAVNSSVIAIFEDARKQTHELAGAARSGDISRLTTAGVTLGQVIVPRLATLEQQHPRAMARLDRCDGA